MRILNESFSMLVDRESTFIVIQQVGMMTPLNHDLFRLLRE